MFLLLFYCYILSLACNVLFIFFFRVAWEAVIRYLPRSSSESWSQGWWMNTCLHAWTHWEYHLPATPSGIVHIHDNGFTLKHFFLRMTHLMVTFYIFFKTFNHDLILKSKPQSTIFEPPTPLNTLVRSSMSLFYNLSRYFSRYFIFIRKCTFHGSVCPSLGL